MIARLLERSSSGNNFNSDREPEGSVMTQFKEALNARYISTHFGRIHSPGRDTFESFARHYRSCYLHLLPRDKNARILDVGCGLGFFLYFLKAEGYVNHKGIDIGQEQIDSCIREVTQQVELVPDTRSYLAGHQSSYDVIVINDVLEHLDEDELFPILEAARDALSLKGRLIVSVPNAACLTSLVTRYADMTHRRLFTEGSLTQLLLCAGFSQVQMLPREKKVIRSFHSRRERWSWELRDKFVRWLLSEFHLHLMEGSYPQVQTINLLGVAEKLSAGGTE